MLGRNHVVVGRGRTNRVRQMNSRAKLCGRESRIGSMYVENAREGVDVRQEIDRVLWEVGEAVVLERGDRGRERIIWRRAVESQTETRNGQRGESLQQPTVGIHRITDEREVQLVEKGAPRHARIRGVE